MQIDDKYVQRISQKYNHKHTATFAQKNAEKKFLLPFGLTLHSTPPSFFGENQELLSDSDQFNLFAAIHFMKYKLFKCKHKKCKERYLKIYTALRNRGISANQALVTVCRIRFMQKNPGADESDLMERGYLALIRSVDGFDPWRGFKFSTYAYSSILRSFYAKKISDYSVVSIEGTSDDISYEPDEEKDGVWAERIQSILQSNTLNERERMIINCRFHDSLTLDDTGKKLQLSRERIRQIQTVSLNKLREALNTDPILVGPINSAMNKEEFHAAI